jgi:hypothetical protein
LWSESASPPKTTDELADISTSNPNFSLICLQVIAKLGSKNTFGPNFHGTPAKFSSTSERYIFTLASSSIFKFQLYMSYSAEAALN